MLAVTSFGRYCTRTGLKTGAKVQKRNLNIKAGRKRVVTLIPGDGIGPEITASTLGVLQAAGAPIEFDRFDEIGDDLPTEMLTRYV